MSVNGHDHDVPRDDVPELQGDFSDMVEQLAKLLREDDERMALRDAEADAAFAEADELRAEQARAGELGPDWRVIQGRIDAGGTTLQAVFSGEDDSSEAANLRDVARHNLEELRASWSDDADEEAPTAPDVVFAQTLRDSRARFEHAAARIQDALEAARRREVGDV